jgi:hypothetical protein
VVEDPNDPDSQRFETARLSSVQRLSSIWDFKFEISDLKLIVVLLQFGKSVDRRQYLATEATRPSRASTVMQRTAEEKCGSFLRENGAKETKGPVAQLVRAHA